MSLPGSISGVDQLDQVLSEPGPAVVEFLKSTSGDFLVLGAAGKMGPSLSLMLKRGLEQAGLKRRLRAVSRFSEKAALDFFSKHGIETLSADLLDPRVVESLPSAENVFYLAGRKFGTQGSESMTWAMNALVPAYVASKFRSSRIVALSTGCVYPMVPVDGGGSREADPVGPPGEYAQSCLARERMFEYHSLLHQTPACLIRLNYAIDLRYGVLLDIAKKVKEGRPVDLTKPVVNVLWQGDANRRIVLSLGHCASPPKVLNLTGPGKLLVKELAVKFGAIFGKKADFQGSPDSTAWISDASHSLDLFGQPQVSVDLMVSWTAAWVQSGGHELGKPTHFESKSGKF